jgi:hypothetical protein
MTLAQSAASTGYDVLLQAMNIVQTICLTYIAARWGALERSHQGQPPVGPVAPSRPPEPPGAVEGR